MSEIGGRATYLGILAFPIDLGDDSKQGLQFTNGSGSFVDRRGVLIYIQILGGGRSQGRV